MDLFKEKRAADGRIQFGEAYVGTLKGRVKKDVNVVVVGVQDGEIMCVVERDMRLEKLSAFTNLRRQVEGRRMLPWSSDGAEYCFASPLSPVTSIFPEHPASAKILTPPSWDDFPEVDNGDPPDDRRSTSILNQYIRKWCLKDRTSVFITRKKVAGEAGWKVSRIFTTPTEVLNIPDNDRFFKAGDARKMVGAFNLSMFAAMKGYHGYRMGRVQGSTREDDLTMGMVVGVLVVMVDGCGLVGCMEKVSRSVDGERLLRIGCWKEKAKSIKVPVARPDRIQTKINRGPMGVIIASRKADVVKCAKCGTAKLQPSHCPPTPHRCLTHPYHSTPTILQPPSAVYTLPVTPAEIAEAGQSPSILSRLLSLTRSHDITIISMLTHTDDTTRLTLTLHIPYLTFEPVFIREEHTNKHRPLYLDSKLEVTIDVAHPATEEMPVYNVCALRALKFLREFCYIYDR